MQKQQRISVGMRYIASGRKHIRHPHILLAILLMLVLAACGGDGDGEEDPVLIPTSTATLSATLTPVPTSTDTPIPTLTSIPVPSDTPTPTIVPTLDPFTRDAFTQSLEPPLSITLPDGWQVGHATQIIQDVDGPRAIPFSVYQGPISGGTGQIILLWGFPSVGPMGNPFMPNTGENFSVYSDGLRLLRLAVFEVGCNIGTGTELTFRIGEDAALGTSIAIVDCPDPATQPDTRGWFAGLRKDGINFIFYMVGYPIGIMDGDAQQDLQAILDTVRFDDIIVTATPEN